MEHPQDILDRASDRSLKSKLTPDEWLDWLKELRDELDMRIATVEAEIKSRQK